MSHSAASITRRPKKKGLTRAQRFERSMANLEAEIDRGWRYFWSKRHMDPPSIAQFDHRRAA